MSISSLQTEKQGLPPPTDALALCQAFNKEEAEVSCGVAKSVTQISDLIKEIVPKLRHGGRLIYTGAGNSGRVAVMDSTELPVTFSVDPKKFFTVISGESEADEDSEENGTTKFEALDLNPSDVVIGISASGRTPFVIAALKVAKAKDSLTAALTNTSPSEISRLGIDYEISTLVGPEFIAGSTRLKAGSSAKQILNMISTCSMILLGKTYRGLMVDVRANNEKLRVRARQIVRTVCPDLEISDVKLDRIIRDCDGSVKLTCAVCGGGLSIKDAKFALKKADGHLEQLLDQKEEEETGEVYLVIDAGGTSCDVAVANKNCLLRRIKVQGTTNTNHISTDDIVERITSAVRQTGFTSFKKVWAGIAGIGHTDQDVLTTKLKQAIHTDRLKLTSDGELLAASIGLAKQDRGVSVVAGTGSVAIRFERVGNDIREVSRAGGWGSLLGDEGSALDLGKQAIRGLLTHIEEGSPLTKLDKEVLRVLATDEGELLGTIYSGDPQRTIAQAARAVTAVPEGEAILRKGATALAKKVAILSKGSNSLLILGGALLNQQSYRELLLQALKDSNVTPSNVIVVEDIAEAAVRYLSQQD